MSDFDSIHIIYNPNSTGGSPQLARELARELKVKLPSIKSVLVKTLHAGHAEQLAEKIAVRSKRPLIISASGDGGYNEVVNGCVRVTSSNHSPVCAVLAAGNANDHARTMQSSSLVDLIIKNRPQQIDLLCVSVNSPNKAACSRYAHSYAGLGLTPTVAAELNSHNLNSMFELWSIVKAFWRLKPVAITQANQRLRVDSLIISTIPEMAKVLKFSSNAQPADGKFEVTIFKHQPKFKLLLKLARGVLKNLPANEHTTQYAFGVVERVPLQLDGEVTMLPAQSAITITIAPKALRTLV